MQSSLPKFSWNLFVNGTTRRLHAMAIGSRLARGYPDKANKKRKHVLLRSRGKPFSCRIAHSVSVVFEGVRALHHDGKRNPKRDWDDDCRSVAVSSSRGCVFLRKCRVSSGRRGYTLSRLRGPGRTKRDNKKQPGSSPEQPGRHRASRDKPGPGRPGSSRERPAPSKANQEKTQQAKTPFGGKALLQC